ncbi:protein-tyrosine phosphatase-like protein [Gloeopeniophorella convolvens]|nr:protein-tyrosine phosphatase-like protein [Gloeopeniophorella convolvens]
MPNASTNNIDTIIDGRLYIGNLSAAKSVDLRRQFGITHTLSVCPDCPSQGPNHFIIPVQDSEYDDILIHLPQACRFIQNALDAGGRVLVHCLMGISRSATVVAAYLMSTRRISPHKALSIIKRARPQVLPNYGFIKQLNTFEACNYEPSKVDPTYRAWKRRHRQDVTYFLNYTTDTTSVVPEKLSLSSDFPKDPEQANCLVAYLGLTHCVSLSPSTTFPPDTGLRHRHFDIPQSNKAGLLLALPSICKHIHNTINDRGRVLVHSSAESTAAIVVCAYCKPKIVIAFTVLTVSQ